MKVLKALLIVSGITVILVVLSVKAFPEWLTIPGGVLLLLGIAFNSVLDAGGKIKGWVELLEKRGASESKPKEVNLTIVPQSKILGGNSYIIINIINNENNVVSCRVEATGIYDKVNENIKREISQYANLFSWSGGSKNGFFDILPGLDGTVNLVVMRTHAYGFYFLFHENPDTNWKKAGVYKLDLYIKGTINEVEFIGKRTIIEFEYIEKEEHDNAGGFFNRGELRLLKWSVEKSE